MSTTSSPVAPQPCVQTPLSVQRPVLSPRKRKLSAIEAASPTSLDEVTPGSSNINSKHSTCNNNSNSNSNSNRHSSCNGKSLEERVISPKKKAKAEDRSSSSSSDQNKWESHVATNVASALDLDAMESLEPVSFSAEPAGDLSAAELELLCRLLA